MGGNESQSQHGDELGDPLRMDEMAVLEVEPAGSAGCKQRLDCQLPPTVGQGGLRIGIGSHDKQFLLASLVAASFTDGPKAGPREPRRHSSRT